MFCLHRRTPHAQNPKALAMRLQKGLRTSLNVTACLTLFLRQIHFVASINKNNWPTEQTDSANMPVLHDVECPWPTRPAINGARHYLLSLCKQARRCPLLPIAFQYSSARNPPPEPDKRHAIQNIAFHKGPIPRCLFARLP